MLLEPRSQIYLYRSTFTTSFVYVHITGPPSGLAYPTRRPSKPRATHTHTHTNITTVALSDQMAAVIRG